MPKLTIDIVGQLANFQDSLNRLEAQASAIGRRIEGAFSGLKFVFAGLATALAGIGLTRLVKDSIDAADALQQLSERTGVSVEKLSAFQYAAKLSDVSAEGLETGLRNLAKNMAAGTDAFESLGVAVRDSNGILRTSDSVLLDLATAFQKLPDGATKSALALKLFGKSGTELIPLLNNGAEGIANFTREAERLGVIVSGETARAADQLNDNLDRLRASFTGIGNIIAANVLGPIAKFTTELEDASKAAGSFSRGLAQLIAGEAGNDAGRKLLEVEERIRSLRLEREKLAGTFGDSGFARSIPGLSRAKEVEYEISSLLVLRDRLKEVQKIRSERAAAEAAPPKRQTDIAPDNEEDRARKAKAETARARAAAAAERELEAKVRAIGFQTAAQAADDAAVASAAYTFETERAAKATADLQSILSQTPTSQIQEVQRQQTVLRKALQDGTVTAEQFGEALALLDDKAADALFGAGDQLKVFADTGTDDIRRLEQAFEGFGRRASDTFAEFVVSGKASFSDLVQSIIKDLISLVAYKAVIGPIFGALGGFFGGAAGKGFLAPTLAKGGVFGPNGMTAFANGGLVTQPTIFPFANGIGLMGEKGTEAIMPLRRGADGRLGVEASGGGGGMSVVQNISITGNVDVATVATMIHASRNELLNVLQRNRARGMG